MLRNSDNQGSFYDAEFICERLISPDSFYLKPLKNRQKQAWEGLIKQIHGAEYCRGTVNQEMPGRMDLEKRKKKLVEVVADARKVLAYAQEFESDPAIANRLRDLKRILRENTESDDHGTPQERICKNKPGNIMVSPIDPDARYGAKSKTKRFTGYKANVTESVESRFITNIKAMYGNRPDGDTAAETVIEQKSHGLVPPKVIGDTAYSDGDYRKTLKENGIEVVAPLRTANTRTREIFPKSMFKHDEEQGTLTCPKGIVTKEAYWDQSKSIRMFHFPMTECNICPVQKQCTKAREGRRTVGISASNAELRAAEIYNATEQFRLDMRLRPAIEGKLSELKRYHGLTRARFRGLRKLGLQCYFAAVAVNVKRWFKLIAKDSLKMLLPATV